MPQLRTAMVSSTARDLPAHREQVMHACLARKVLPIMMEHLPATNADALETSLRMVDSADLFLGVFAHRYGYVPSDGHVSVTQMEYERAVERGIPRLIFLMADDHPLTAADVELGPGATKLAALKQRLRTEHVVAHFHSPADLRAQVLNTLAELESGGSRPGSANGGRGSDLTISSLHGGSRLRALSGHPVLSPDGADQPVFTGGVRVSFTLAHDRQGDAGISVHAIELEVLEYTPGAQPTLHYAVDGAEVIGAGVARPHVFSVSMRGRAVHPARWVHDPASQKAVAAQSTNFLDTPEPQVLTFSPRAEDIEQLQGTILARTGGLYRVRFVFHYSVGGHDRRYETEDIRIYSEE